MKRDDCTVLLDLYRAVAEDCAAKFNAAWTSHPRWSKYPLEAPLGGSGGTAVRCVDFVVPAYAVGLCMLTVDDTHAMAAGTAPWGLLGALASWLWGDARPDVSESQALDLGKTLLSGLEHSRAAAGRTFGDEIPWDVLITWDVGITILPNQVRRRWWFNVVEYLTAVKGPLDAGYACAIAALQDPSVLHRLSTGQMADKAREVDFYELLEVHPKASPEVIDGAYRILAQRHHPDRGGDARMFQRITEARHVLLDPTKRARYDHEHR